MSFRPKVKICGLTNFEDAATAAKLGADLLGFIFAESPRKVDAAIVKNIIDRMRIENLLDGIETVGVFVNESHLSMNQTLKTCGLDIAQIHGDETYHQAKSFDFPWYRALRISSPDDLEKIVDEGWLSGRQKRILFDTAVAGSYGGSGESIPIPIAIAARDLCTKSGMEFFLAGGINPENVHSIIENINPFGIDIGSGVEESKGKKSVQKLDALFANINL